MDSVLTRKIGPGERYSIFNGLSSIPVLLLGKSTIIDLLNDTSVAGIVDDVDGYMNITMVNVVFIDQRLQQHAFDAFHVQARNIRLFHIPESIKLEPEMRRLFERFSGRNQKKNVNTSKAHTFKAKRAQLRQQETLRELASAAEPVKQSDGASQAGPSNQ